MALTTMDTTPALVVIDLQKGITAVPVAHPAPPHTRCATPQYPQREPSLSASTGSSQPHRPR